MVIVILVSAHTISGDTSGGGTVFSVRILLVAGLTTAIHFMFVFLFVSPSVLFHFPWSVGDLSFVSCV